MTEYSIQRIESNVETGEVTYFDENEQQVSPPEPTSKTASESVTPDEIKAAFGL